MCWASRGGRRWRWRWQGTGPLARLDLALTLDAARQRVLTGTTRLRQQADGLGFAANLEGPIASSSRAQLPRLLRRRDQACRQRRVQDAGGLLLDEPRSATARRSASRRGGNHRGRFPAEPEARRHHRRRGPAEKVVLPVPGGETTVERAALNLRSARAQTKNGAASLDSRQTRDRHLRARHSVALNDGRHSPRTSVAAGGKPQHHLRRPTAAQPASSPTRADVQEALGEPHRPRHRRRLERRPAGPARQGAAVRQRAQRVACRRHRRTRLQAATSR